MTGQPMTACPRFGSCSAPLCPLDPERPRRSHLRGEPVCAYLREFVKADGPARVKRALPQESFQAVAASAAELAARPSPLFHALQRAAHKQSQLASGKTLRQRRRRARAAEPASPGFPTTNTADHLGSATQESLT